MDRTKADAASPPSDATHSQPAGANETQAAAGLPPALAHHPQVLGGYRVVRLLGQGGMGAVYHARDDQLARDLAVKTMKPEVAAQPGAVERFVREARAAAKVEHDNVIPILHVGQDNGTPFIAMPLLKGLPLDRWLRGDGVVPLGVVLKVGRETADGLAAAHEKGLIHRDIKPANIWLEGDPTATDLNAQFRRVKILDFGLARPTTDDGHLTHSGAVIGTPAYMSPEQARAEPIDHRTDLFSLGVVLYRMTTGVMPFRGGSTMAVLTSLAVDTPPAPAVSANVPHALADLIMRLLAKDRAHRPAGAAAVAAELRAIGERARRAADAALSHSAPIPVSPQPAAVAPPGNPFADIDHTDPTEPEGEDEDERTEVAPAPPAPKRRGVWLAIGGALLAAAVAVAAAVALSGPKKKQPPDAPPVSEAAKGAPRPLPPVQPSAAWEPLFNGKNLDGWKAYPSGTGDWRVEDGAMVCDGTRNYTYLYSAGDQYDDFAVRAEVMVRSNSDGGLFVRAAFRPDHPTGYETQIRVADDGDTCRTGSLLKWATEVGPKPKERLLYLVDARSVTPGVWFNLETTAVGNSVSVKIDGREVSSYRDNTAHYTKGHFALQVGEKTRIAVRKFEVMRLTPDGKPAPPRSKDAGRAAEPSGHTAAGPAASRDRAAAAWAAGAGGRVTVYTPGGSVVFTMPTDTPADTRVVVHIDFSQRPAAIGDADLDNLAGLTGLRDLLLSGTNVTADGVQKLAKMLPRCKIVWTGGTVLPSSALPASPTDRDVAEWALAAGSVQIRDGDRERYVTKDAPLPDGPVTVTYVNMGPQSAVTDADLAKLAALPELRRLSVAGPYVTDAGLKHVGRMTALTELSAYECPVTDAGAAALAGLTELDFLGLSKSGVTDAALVHLKGMTRLKTLQLNRTKVTDAGLEHLAGLTRLEFLFLSGTEVTGSGLAHLKGFDRIVNIKLDGSSVTDEGLKLLIPLKKTLAALNLSDTAVTDTGLRHVRELGALQMLELDSTAVTDAGMEHVAALPNLTGLSVRRTKVTAAGVARVKKARPDCLVGSDAAAPAGDDRKAVAWAFSVGGHARVRSGNEARNVSAAKDLPQGPFVLTHLALADLGAKVTDAGLANLAGLTDLLELNLSNTPTTDAGLAHLRDAKNLRAAFLSGTQVTDAGLDHLAGMGALTHLDLARTKVTAAGLTRLTNHPGLTFLAFGGKSITDDDLRHLKGLVELERLALDRASVTGSGLEHLTGLTRLTQLELTRSAVTDSGLASVAKLKRLKALEVSGTRVTDAGLDHIRGLTGLQELGVSDTAVTDAGFARLAGLTELVALGAIATKVTDDGLGHLKNCKKLRELYLSETAVTDAGLERVAGFTELKTLDVLKTAVTAGGVARLQKALPKCKIDWGAPKK